MEGRTRRTIRSSEGDSRERAPSPLRLLESLALSLLQTNRRRVVQGAPQGRDTRRSESARAALAQFHAAEYSAERGSVDAWKTLQYATVPIVLTTWALLIQVSAFLGFELLVWLCATTLCTSLVAYQKAMVDALTGIKLIETRVRQSAIELAGTDGFWFHEPQYRSDVPKDWAYWPWTPLSIACSSVAGALFLRLPTYPNGSWTLSVLDALGAIVCLLLVRTIHRLSKDGVTLERDITLAIESQNLSWVSVK